MRRVSVFLLLLCAFIAVYCSSQESGDTDACLGCHKEKFSQHKEFVHPLIKQGKCKACHSSYDIASHKERIKSGLEDCMDCHTQEKLGRSHPVGRGIIDPNTNNTLTCVSTCHTPHGSGYKYFMPFENNMQLCTSCHKDF